MNRETSQAVSTCAVWISVACILTFGICRMNVNGDMVVFLVMFLLPVGIVAAAGVATCAVWKGTWTKSPPAGPAGPAGPGSAAPAAPPVIPS